MTTRERLISLLSQIPTAKEIELHDGRRLAPDARVEEVFADKIMALFASPIPSMLVVGEDVSKVMTAALKELQIDPMHRMTIVPAADYYQDTAAEMYGELTRVSLELAWYEAHEEKAQREGTHDLFERVMTASEAYVTRFGGTLNHYGAAKKMDEEMREFDTSAANYVHARLSTTPMSMRLKTPDQLEREMLQEYIDFMVTVGGWFAAMGIDWDDIKQAAHGTLAKLDTRTPDTHAWNPDTMTVERIGKVTP